MKRTSVRLDRNIAQRMQESVSMHKSPSPVRHSRMNQTRSEDGFKERKRDWTDRVQEADGTKVSPTNHNLFEELKHGLPAPRE